MDAAEVVFRRLVTFRLQSDDDNLDLAERLDLLGEDFSAASGEFTERDHWSMLVQEAVDVIEKLLDVMAHPGLVDGTSPLWAGSLWADRRPAVQRAWIAYLNMD